MRLVAACLALVCLAAPAGAQQPAQVPHTQFQVKQSFAPLVQRVTPAVVNVYASRIEKQTRNPLMEDPFFRRFFGGPDSAPQERVQRSLGSGVIVDPAGFVVTNNHVIENMTDVRVSLADRREFGADIVLRDTRSDLAVLRIKGGSGFPTLELGDSDALEVGDLVLAVGNPFGVGQTVTSGIISAVARTHVGATDYQFFIQTDAAINPGNSGGALVSSTGQLIGVNTAIFSQSGGSHGIGFAIPSNMVRVVVASAKAGAKVVRRPWFGARMQPVSSDLVESVGLDRPVGALIASVVEKGPAAEAGLKPGDVVLAIDGQEVDDAEAFGFRFATKPTGGEATLTVLRGGRKTTAKVRLAPAPETRPRDSLMLRGRWPLAGLTVANLSPALAEEIGMDYPGDGVVVTDVAAGTPAQELGLRKGDMVLRVDDEAVATTRALDALAKPRNYYWKLSIRRQGEVVTTVVGG
ncbi:DegQ family serine endoprotease [Alsobacter sp. SYSU M60028]|uniref:DegQ family serine endoprotease n=1 Tax=Alsobacter ponti TaxID=2962936 RepID=A0ABT1LBY7_9HYPH|nr:DegQ family serine endoprotease [Alsobacter ponti]MCP8939007.1 DegQ family serine endoprotease [Alsobacter ponti]